MHRVKPSNSESREYQHPKDTDNKTPEANGSVRPEPKEKGVSEEKPTCQAGVKTKSTHWDCLVKHLINEWNISRPSTPDRRKANWEAS